jgi:hypothetical protein
MSKQLNRKPLLVNNRRGIKQHFTYVEGGYKSDAQPSIVTWRGNGRGVSGESTNSGDQGSKQIVNRNWRPI